MTTLADKRNAVDAAAGVASGLWISFGLALFYSALAVAEVTHKNLLLENGMRLPFLSIDLPLLSVFWLGPMILIVMHAYVLHHLVLLARKARILDVDLNPSPDERDLLPINLFVQLLIGQPNGPRQPAIALAALIAWITLVVGPVAVLVLFELQFLPYHDEAATWWARMTIVLDLLLIYRLWPEVACRNNQSWQRADIGRISRWGTAALAFAAVYVAFFVATFVGEELDTLLAHLPVVPLHETLVAGPIDENDLVPTSLWSNRLVVPGVAVFDRDRYDTPGKLAAAPPLLSLRNRHLERAILTEARLSRIDLSGAHLQGALLLRAHAEGAWFDRADMTGAQLDDSEMPGASFYRTRMVGATMSHALLLGAQLASANLQAAWMVGTELSGASLASADLRHATLDEALLFGASLNGAFLQGASMAKAKLEGAAFNQAHLWQVDFSGVDAGSGMSMTAPPDLTTEAAACQPLPNNACQPEEKREAVQLLIQRYVPNGDARDTMIKRANWPFGPDGWQETSKTAFAAIRALPDADPGLATLWSRIACASKGAPFGLTALLDTYHDDKGWTRPHGTPGTILLIGMLRGETCAAGQALPEVFKMHLLDLARDREPAPEPAHVASTP